MATYDSNVRAPKIWRRLAGWCALRGARVARIRRRGRGRSPGASVRSRRGSGVGRRALSLRSTTPRHARDRIATRARTRRPRRRGVRRRARFLPTRPRRRDDTDRDGAHSSTARAHHAGRPCCRRNVASSSAASVYVGTERSAATNSLSAPATSPRAARTRASSTRTAAKSVSSSSAC